MEDWTEQQVKQLSAHPGKRMFIYFYTPMCGTCKVTERMLEVILAMKPELPIVKCNINFSPDLAQRWQLESVPSIAYVVDGEAADKRYRMQSVDDLLRWFQHKE
ncbi:thioredoxin family protein [Paenibacillus sp. NPDC056579]|uniref:thioredoxin family protein n=1 Tax=Paenibacillus sp. NPDC056579 TaxID=3345871 RepID=UPI0036B82CF8